MHRNIFQPLRTLAALGIAVGAIACADRAGPTGLAELAADASNRKADSASCDLSVSGTIWRYSGAGDSASDTLGRLVPLPGARVEFYWVAPLPRDSVPRDSVPRDSVPRDSVPRDSVPRDSVPRDSGFARALSIRAAAGDSGRGGNGGGVDTTRGPARQPDAKGSSRGNGTYSVDGLCPGVYRVEVHEPGTRRSISTWIIVRGDIRHLNFAFPPRR